MREYLELQDAIAALRESLRYQDPDYNAAADVVAAFDKYEERRKPHGPSGIPYDWSLQ